LPTTIGDWGILGAVCCPSWLVLFQPDDTRRDQDRCIPNLIAAFNLLKLY